MKKLRLRDLSTPEVATPYLGEFMADYNRRFARPPREAYDAHRPVRPDEDLEAILTLQTERRITRQLTLTYKRALYLLEDSVAIRRLRGATATIREAADGTITLTCAGATLPYRVFQKDTARIAPGALVEHTRLGAALAQIAAQQQERDARRLRSRKVTLREKQRIRAAAGGS